MKAKSISTTALAILCVFAAAAPIHVADGQLVKRATACDGSSCDLPEKRSTLYRPGNNKPQIIPDPVMPGDDDDWNQPGAPGQSDDDWNEPGSPGESNDNWNEPGNPGTGNDDWNNPGSPGDNDNWDQPGSPGQSNDDWNEPGSTGEPGNDDWNEPGSADPTDPGNSSDDWNDPGAKLKTRSDDWNTPGGDAQVEHAKRSPGSALAARDLLTKTREKSRRV
jgi:hypothetical protein